MLYPQNGDRIVTINSMTSLHPIYILQSSWYEAAAKHVCFLRNVKRCSSYKTSYTRLVTLGIFWAKQVGCIQSADQLNGLVSGSAMTYNSRATFLWIMRCLQQLCLSCVLSLAYIMDSMRNCARYCSSRGIWLPYIFYRLLGPWNGEHALLFY